MVKARKLIEPADVTAVIDTREQRRLNLDPLVAVTGTLATGDYSVRGLEHLIAVERKSLPDLVGCVGRERERFEREVQRLLAYETRAVIVEATWQELEGGNWRGSVSPSQVVGSVLGWIAQGLPVVLVGDHATAGRYASRLLFVSARRRWRELQSFYNHLKIAGGE